MSGPRKLTQLIRQASEAGVLRAVDDQIAAARKAVDTGVKAQLEQGGKIATGVKPVNGKTPKGKAPSVVALDELETAIKAAVKAKKEAAAKATASAANRHGPDSKPWTEFFTPKSKQ